MAPPNVKTIKLKLSQQFKRPQNTLQFYQWTNLWCWRLAIWDHLWPLRWLRRSKLLGRNPCRRPHWWCCAEFSSHPYSLHPLNWLPNLNPREWHKTKNPNSINAKTQAERVKFCNIRSQPIKKFTTTDSRTISIQLKVLILNRQHKYGVLFFTQNPMSCIDHYLLLIPFNPTAKT